MEEFGGLAVGGLLLLVAIGWYLHFKNEEPAEFVLFVAILLGLLLASIGLVSWVPWLWYGTSAITVTWIARGRRRRRRRPRHAGGRQRPEGH